VINRDLINREERDRMTGSYRMDRRRVFRGKGNMLGAVVPREEPGRDGS